MSDFSLTLVLKIKTSKIINDMAKVQQKSEKISAFGGIFFVLDKFDRILSSVIDSHLGLRSKLIGYQYSEIIRAVFSVFCCGGDSQSELGSPEISAVNNLRSQIVISRFHDNWGGNRRPPYAFTEIGVAMLSSVLKSEVAIQANRKIMKAFVAYRHLAELPLAATYLDLRK